MNPIAHNQSIAADLLAALASLTKTHHLLRRHQIRLPTMTTTTSQTATFLTAQNFASPETLTEWLKPRLPEDLPSWGVKPGTKNVANLWLELTHGEALLQDSFPPCRTVNVASVRLRNPAGLVLVESHQELSDGNVRPRGRPLSEKMKPGETIGEAVVRAIHEELGSVLPSGDGVRVLMESCSTKVEERDSLSYPGLPARYVLHSVDAIVEEGLLPEGEFFTEEEDEYGTNGGVVAGAIGVRRHFWKWVSPEDASAGSS